MKHPVLCVKQYGRIKVLWHGILEMLPDIVRIHRRRNVYSKLQTRSQGELFYDASTYWYLPASATAVTWNEQSFADEYPDLSVLSFKAVLNLQLSAIEAFSIKAGVLRKADFKWDVSNDLQGRKPSLHMSIAQELSNQ